MKKWIFPIAALFLSMLAQKVLYAQSTTVNFDDASKWTGSLSFGAYATNYVYTDGLARFEGGPALRSSSATLQDGYSEFLGTYSWKLRNQSDVNWITTISSGGVSSFSYKIRRWDSDPSPNFNLDFSIDGGTNWVNVAVINNTTLDNSSDWKVFSGTINSNVDNILIRIIANGSTERIMIDDFTWSAFGSEMVDEPSALQLTIISSSQIDLLASKNTANNNLLIAYSTDGIFGTPNISTTYTQGSTIDGGGIVLSNGSAATLSHTALNPHTTYYYAAWSISTNGNYSPAIYNNTSTWGLTPDNPATNSAAVSNSYNNATLTWDYTQGTNPADGFLIIGSITDDIQAPSDGTWVENDSDWSDGKISATISASTTSYLFSNLNAETTYYFAIFPYANTSTSVLFNTSTSTNKSSVSTASTPNFPVVWINEFHYDNVDADINEQVEIVLKNANQYNLSEIELILYNGGDGKTYGTHALSTFNQGESDGDYAVFYKEIAGGIQNGPDGFALSYQSAYIPNTFVSYETGTITALNGPAIGVTSVNIGVSESGTTPTTSSIQLVGYGLSFADFTWTNETASAGNINSNQYLGIQNMWTGANGTDWNNADNWSQGVPESNHFVTIPSEGINNFPALTSTPTVKGITLKSDAQLNGQEHITSSQSVTIERQFLLSTNAQNLRWAYYASPFQNTTLEQMKSTNKSIDLYAAAYRKIESENINDSWNLALSQNEILPTAEGIALAAVYDDTENSTGGTAVSDNFYLMKQNGSLLNLNADIEATLTIQNSNGWNLIGNPYLASIDWTHESWDFSNLQSPSAYILDPSTGSYITLKNDGTTIPSGGSTRIAPLQGFFVDAISASNFVIPKAARSILSSSFFKSATTDASLSLSVRSNDFTDETIIEFNPEASNGFSIGDARKMWASNSQIPQIATLCEGQSLVKNQLKEYPIEIPVLVKFVEDQETELKITGIENIPDAYKIEWIDNQTNKTFDLRQNNVIQLIGTSGEMNFTLQIDSETHINKMNLDFKPKVQNGFLYLNLSDIDGKQLQISDITGRICHSSTLSMQSAPIDVSNLLGIYIIQVIGENGSAVKKIRIN